MSEKNLIGHIKDALTHAKADNVPEEKIPEFVAIYISQHHSPVAIAGMYENAYEALKYSINKALDVRDSRGDTLRDYRFEAPGFVKEVQDFLLKGLARADNIIH